MWYKCSEFLPGNIEDADGAHWRYSKTVMFKDNRGFEYRGWIRFDYMEWIVSGKGIHFYMEDIKEWRDLTEEEKGSE